MDIIMDITVCIALLLAAMIVIGIVYLIIVTIYRKTLRYETFPSTAIVCAKKHKKAYTTTRMVRFGRITVPQMYYHAEEYSVCIKYDGKEFCRDDEKLYKSVEVGDEVRVLVHKGYNKHNKLKHIYLS